MTTKAKPTGLDLMREPFPAHQISKLPKPTKAQTDAVKSDFKAGIRCDICGGWHHPKVVHLDYVGHAALTDRLLECDPSWQWEPLAFNEFGLPLFDPSGGLWIKLTVCDVTRLGYGHAAQKQGVDPGAREKEVIGDGLRNAAMRFGAALDLWHKGDLHVDDEPEKEPEALDTMPDHEWARLAQLVQATSSNIPQLLKALKITLPNDNLQLLSQDDYPRAVNALETKLARMAQEQTNAKAKEAE